MNGFIQAFVSDGPHLLELRRLRGSKSKFYSFFLVSLWVRFFKPVCISPFLFSFIVSFDSASHIAAIQATITAYPSAIAGFFPLCPVREHHAQEGEQDTEALEPADGLL